MQTRKKPGHFPGMIVRFADGDTAIVLIKTGWGVWLEKHTRILGVDSWELGSEHDAKAQDVRRECDRLWSWTPCTVIMSARGLDKYGRFRARIDVDGHDLAQMLVEKGLAWFRKGKKASPVPPGASQDAPGSTITEPMVC